MPNNRTVSPEEIEDAEAIVKAVWPSMIRPTTEATTETPISTSEAAFDPAPGVDLSDAYANRMAVRVERDKIAEGEHLPKPVSAAQVDAMLNQPGRQTSPELATLASKWSKLTGEELLAQAMAGRSGEVAEVVRRLAASVLSQVNG